MSIVPSLGEPSIAGCRHCRPCTHRQRFRWDNSGPPLACCCSLLAVRTPNDGRVHVVVNPSELTGLRSGADIQVSGEWVPQATMAAAATMSSRGTTRKQTSRGKTNGGGPRLFKAIRVRRVGAGQADWHAVTAGACVPAGMMSKACRSAPSDGSDGITTAPLLSHVPDRSLLLAASTQPDASTVAAASAPPPQFSSNPLITADLPVIIIPSECLGWDGQGCSATSLQPDAPQIVPRPFHLREQSPA